LLELRHRFIADLDLSIWVSAHNGAFDLEAARNFIASFWWYVQSRTIAFWISFMEALNHQFMESHGFSGQ